MTLSSLAIDEIWTNFITTGRPDIRETLILHYMPLVRFVVSRLGIPPTSMLEADDLVSYGTIGLVNAVDRYDPQRGVRFEAFATSRIRGAVIDQLRALNWLPRSAVSRVKQVETTLATLEQRLGRHANEDEAAKELGVTVDRYRHMLVEAGISVLSLDVPLTMFGQDEDLLTLRDLLEDSTPGPDECAEQKELLAVLHQSLDLLPEREQLLLSLYYIEELTMKEISRVMDVSESRVCQLHAQALLRLRTLLASANDVQRKPKKLKTTVSSGSKRMSKARSEKVAS